MKNGMDVSEWQGDIDYSKACKQVDFVIPRTGFALTTDNKYRRNVKEATRYGLSVPAVYHFSYSLTDADALAEANYAISEVVAAGLSKSTIIFFDLEYSSMDYAERKGVTMTREMVNRFTKIFCDQCLAKGYRTGIYLNNDYYKNIYFPDTLNDKRYLIWLADWTGGPDHPCYIQQYTSKGKVDGVKGNVDMNYIFDDTPDKIPYDVAQEVIAGKWGFGADRKVKLENAGYNYSEIQGLVNMILTDKADTQDKRPQNGTAIKLQQSSLHSGEYYVLQDEYMRLGAGDNKYALVLLPAGTHVFCCGFYDVVDDEVYLYCHATPFANGMVYAGFVQKSHCKIVGRDCYSAKNTISIIGGNSDN